MANGPGARIVDRVGVLVLPDTSKFHPALKKYLARIAKQERLEIRTELDESGLARQAKTATETASRRAKVTASGDLADGFLSQMQRDVSAAMRKIEADVPLTADGERLRRDARAKVTELQSTMAQMALEVPLDPEASAAAKADLRKEIAELQALAKAQSIDVPLGVSTSGLSSLGSGGGGLSALTGPGGVAAIVALIGNAVIALGMTIAALPALLMSVVAPLGVIALGWEGIATAAKEASPGFTALKDAVSARFAQDLAPAFRDIGKALPKLIPSFTSLAGALSTAFSGVVDTLTSPEGIDKITGIIDNITRAVQILSPVLGPMVDLFLDFALTGTQAFADNAPMLLSALQTMTDIFQDLNDSGALAMAVTGFTQMVTLAVLLFGGMTALAIGVAAAYTWVMSLAHGFMDWLIPQIGVAGVAVAGFALSVAAHLATLPLLAAPAVALLAGIIGGGVTSAMRLGTTAASVGVAAITAAVGLLPGLISGVLSNFGPTLAGIVSGGFRSATTAATVGVTAVVAAASLLPGLVLGVLSSLGSQLRSLALGAMGDMQSGISGGIVGIVGAVTMLGAQIVGAFAGLGAQMFSKGAGMVSSLASGMLSKLPSVTSASGIVAGRIAGFFRGSPVKEGPLTSWNYGGDTSGAGRKMIADLARGMSAQSDAVAAAARGVAGRVAGAGDAALEAGAGGGGLAALSKQELIEALERGTYRGSAQLRTDELSQASSTSRGRARR